MDSIFLLFEKVETKHGWPLVSHALAYVTAAKNGVSETELEDLISLDDKVLDDIYQYHLPPTRRIPPLLWTRYVPFVSNTRVRLICKFSSHSSCMTRMSQGLGFQGSKESEGSQRFFRSQVFSRGYTGHTGPGPKVLLGPIVPRVPGIPWAMLYK